MVADPCADTNHLSNAEERPLSEPPIEGWLKCDIGIHWCRNSLISHDFNRIEAFSLTETTSMATVELSTVMVELSTATEPDLLCKYERSRHWSSRASRSEDGRDDRARRGVN
ncbi:hypothetical protein YC2023_076340 [Brassica napus]